MDNQRIRNLTTNRIHTSMDHIAEDLCFLTGFNGLLDAQLLDINEAIKPYLKKQLGESSRFFDGKYDVTHIGNTELRPLNSNELLQLRY